jgi:hypothetical protein
MIKETFSFEHTFRFTEDLYISLNSTLKRKSRPVRLLLVTVAGVACLFWSYTLLLGVALLIMVGMAIFLPSRIPATAANTYRNTAYLHDELTYGVNGKELWIRGPRLNIEVSWENVAVWDDRAGWLKISANHTPSIWFPTDKLREANVYDNIIDLCKRHGVKFGSKEAAEKLISNKRLRGIARKSGSR